MTLILTGLDIAEKASWAEDLVFGTLGGKDQFAESTSNCCGSTPLTRRPMPRQPLTCASP